MSSPALPLPVMVAFAHASVQCLADDHSLNLLHIKGPALDQAIARGRDGGERRRTSGDADVLVRPDQVRRFMDLVRRQGWELVINFPDGSAFEHAATMRHPKLGYLDVHRSFPGFRVDAADAFEVLWASRKVADIGGYPCPVPEAAGQRLMLMLHAARSGTQIGRDVGAAWDSADPTERLAVEALATRLKARVALAAALGRLDDMLDDPDHDLWQQLSGGRTSLFKLWLARVRAARGLRQKVATGLGAFLPKPGRLTQRLGRPPTTGELVAATGRRVHLALRELARMARSRLNRTRR